MWSEQAEARLDVTCKTEAHAAHDLTLLEQSLEDQSTRKRRCSKRRRVTKFLQEANAVSISNCTQVAREHEVSIATFAEELKSNSEGLSASRRGVGAEHLQ